MDRCANDFNSAIKYLARVYAHKKKDSFEIEKILRNNKRFDIIASTYPSFCIEKVGPLFLKYADEIKNRDFDAILNLDFEQEKRVYKNSDDGSKHSYKDMDVKIEFLKNMFKMSNTEERKALVDTFDKLLSAYCEYALAAKDLVE